MDDALSRISTADLQERRDELLGQTEFRLKCPYAHCCWEFASTLGVDDRLFNHVHDRCYCEECQREGDPGAAEPEPEPEGADAGGLSPEQRAEQLKGWVYLGLKLDDARVAARGAWDWDTAFHGTRADSFEKIVNTGYLLIPGDVTPEGARLGVRDGHIKGGHLREGRVDDRLEAVGGGAGLQVALETFEPEKMAFVSPSLAYAAHPCYAASTEYGGCEARAVLKFKVSAESHPTPPVDGDGGTGRTTLRRTPEDPFVGEDEMEWCE